MSQTRAEYTQRRLVRFSEGTGATCTKDFLARCFTPKLPKGTRRENTLPTMALLSAMVRGFRKSFIKRFFGEQVAT